MDATRIEFTLKKKNSEKIEWRTNNKLLFKIAQFISLTRFEHSLFSPCQVDCDQIGKDKGSSMRRKREQCGCEFWRYFGLIDTKHSHIYICMISIIRSFLTFYFDGGNIWYVYYILYKSHQICRRRCRFISNSTLGYKEPLQNTNTFIFFLFFLLLMSKLISFVFFKALKLTLVLLIAILKFAFHFFWTKCFWILFIFNRDDYFMNYYFE